MQFCRGTWVLVCQADRRCSPEGSSLAEPQCSGTTTQSSHVLEKQQVLQKGALTKRPILSKLLRMLCNASGRGGIGRRARLRIWSSIARVEVQILSSALVKNGVFGNRKVRPETPFFYGTLLGTLLGTKRSVISRFLAARKSS